jgi:transcriptional regulator with XRE-family HTH domain
MLPSITFGYSDAIAQGYPGLSHAVAMGKSAIDLGFWSRLTARISEKWPSKYPTPSSVTQTGVGKLFGVTQPSVYKWENLGVLPERKRIAEIAIALGVTMEWLETGRGPKFVPNSEDPVSMEIFRLVADADELQRMEFLNYLQYLSGKDEKQVNRR